MLIPLFVLAVGAVAGRHRLQGGFIGHDYKTFWQARSAEGPHNHIMHAMHDVPEEWVYWAPFVAMLSGFGLAYLYYIRRPALPAATARTFRPIYLFFLNKWYFDELYDWLFVKPAMAIGRFLWKGGDGAIIDGADPTAPRAAYLDDRQGRQAADRLRLSLRVRDADRRGADHGLRDVRSGGGLQ